MAPPTGTRKTTDPPKGPSKITTADGSSILQAGYSRKTIYRVRNTHHHRDSACDDISFDHTAGGLHNNYFDVDMSLRNTGYSYPNSQQNIANQQMVDLLSSQLQTQSNTLPQQRNTGNNYSNTIETTLDWINCTSPHQRNPNNYMRGYPLTTRINQHMKQLLTVIHLQNEYIRSNELSAQKNNYTQANQILTSRNQQTDYTYANHVSPNINQRNDYTHANQVLTSRNLQTDSTHANHLSPNINQRKDYTHANQVLTSRNLQTDSTYANQLSSHINQQKNYTHANQVLTSGNQQTDSTYANQLSPQQKNYTHGNRVSPHINQQRNYTHANQLAASVNQANDYPHVNQLSPHVNQQKNHTHANQVLASGNQQTDSTHVNQVSPQQKNYTHVNRVSPQCQQNDYTLAMTSDNQQKNYTHANQVLTSGNQQTYSTHANQESPLINQQNNYTPANQLLASVNHANDSTHVNQLSPHVNQQRNYTHSNQVLASGIQQNHSAHANQVSSLINQQKNYKPANQVLTSVNQQTDHTHGDRVSPRINEINKYTIHNRNGNGHSYDLVRMMHTLTQGNEMSTSAPEVNEKNNGIKETSSPQSSITSKESVAHKDITRVKLPLENTSTGTTKDNNNIRPGVLQRLPGTTKEHNIPLDVLQGPLGARKNNNNIGPEVLERPTGETKNNNNIRAEVLERPTGATKNNNNIRAEVLERPTGETRDKNNIPLGVIQGPLGATKNINNIGPELLERPTGETRDNNNTPSDVLERPTGATKEPNIPPDVLQRPPTDTTNTGDKPKDFPFAIIYEKYWNRQQNLNELVDKTNDPSYSCSPSSFNGNLPKPSVLSTLYKSPPTLTEDVHSKRKDAASSISNVCSSSNVSTKSNHNPASVANQMQTKKLPNSRQEELTQQKTNSKYKNKDKNKIKNKKKKNNQNKDNNTNNNTNNNISNHVTTDNVQHNRKKNTKKQNGDYIQSERLQCSSNATTDLSQPQMSNINNNSYSNHVNNYVTTDKENVNGVSNGNERELTSVFTTNNTINIINNKNIDANHPHNDSNGMLASIAHEYTNQLKRLSSVKYISSDCNQATTNISTDSQSYVKVETYDASSIENTCTEGSSQLKPDDRTANQIINTPLRHNTTANRIVSISANKIQNKPNNPSAACLTVTDSTNPKRKNNVEGESPVSHSTPSTSRCRKPGSIVVKFPFKSKCEKQGDIEPYVEALCGSATISSKCNDLQGGKVCNEEPFFEINQTDVDLRCKQEDMPTPDITPQSEPLPTDKSPICSDFFPLSRNMDTTDFEMVGPSNVNHFALQTSCSNTVVNSPMNSISESLLELHNKLFPVISSSDYAQHLCDNLLSDVGMHGRVIDEDDILSHIRNHLKVQSECVEIQKNPKEKQYTQVNGNIVSSLSTNEGYNPNKENGLPLISSTVEEVESNINSAEVRTGTGNIICSLATKKGYNPNKENKLHRELKNSPESLTRKKLANSQKSQNNVTDNLHSGKDSVVSLTANSRCEKNVDGKNTKLCSDVENRRMAENCHETDGTNEQFLGPYNSIKTCKVMVKGLEIPNTKATKKCSNKAGNISNTTAISTVLAQKAIGCNLNQNGSTTDKSKGVTNTQVKENTLKRSYECVFYLNHNGKVQCADKSSEKMNKKFHSESEVDFAINSKHIPKLTTYCNSTPKENKKLILASTIKRKYIENIVRKRKKLKLKLKLKEKQNKRLKTKPRDNFIRILKGTANENEGRVKLHTLNLNPRVIMQDIFQTHLSSTVNISRFKNTKTVAIDREARASHKTSFTDPNMGFSSSQSTQITINKRKLKVLRKLCDFIHI